MGQRKGQTGNKKGRTKGSPNKVTANLKEKIQLFIELNFDQIQADFALLEPRERVIIYERMLKYVIPQKIENEIIQIDSAPIIIIKPPIGYKYFKEMQYNKPLEILDTNK